MNIRRYLNRRTVSRLLGHTIANRLADRFPYRRPGLPPLDVFEFYRFLSNEPFGKTLDPRHQPESNTINWFVPPIGKGSGGHLNIFRFVHHLEQMGFSCRIIVCDPQNLSSSDQLQRNIGDWFFKIAAPVYVHPRDEIPAAYHSIATGWQTAYPVRNFKSTVNRVYFVQDFEPYFYPPGSEYAFAETSYRFGFSALTAGGWLKEKLASDYGMRTQAFGFSYDADLYKPTPRRQGRHRNILVYARPVTPRRGFELSLLALKTVTDRLPDTAVIFAGWDVGSYKIPFPHLNAGSVEISSLPDLYSQCDAALVISMTNLSLLPLELMACGCPVISNRGANVEWLLDANVSELADATPEGLANGLLNVLTDETRRQQLIVNGLALTSRTSWNAEAAIVAQFLREQAD
jgi:glycosyltransferase involved in cell wall biosynthesis